MLNLKRTRGQSMAEYAIVIAVVITAVVAMQLYAKRALQGKIKAVSDNVGFGLLNAGYVATAIPNQYEPYYASTNYTIGQNQSIQEQYQTGGAVARNSISEQTTRTGTAQTGGAAQLTSDDAWQ
jgi:hypothetical protein